MELVHHHLEACTFKDYINFMAGCWSWMKNSSLGWVGTASGSVICPELY
jgi:hypothetical protein